MQSNDKSLPKSEYTVANSCFLSENRVSRELLDAEAEAAMGHIELAKWADGIFDVPATANTLARLSSSVGEMILLLL